MNLSLFRLYLTFNTGQVGSAFIFGKPFPGFRLRYEFVDGDTTWDYPIGQFADSLLLRSARLHIARFSGALICYTTNDHNYNLPTMYGLRK